MAALLKNKGTTISLLLTAILAMAAVFSSPYLANGENNCFPWQEQGKPCDHETCVKVCTGHGYILGFCGHPPPGKAGGDREFCCCYDSEH